MVLVAEVVDAINYQHSTSDACSIGGSQQALFDSSSAVSAAVAAARSAGGDDGGQGNPDNDYAGESARITWTER